MNFLGFGDFLKGLIDHLNDAIFIIDPEDYSILEVNETACKSLGYGYEELRALKVSDFDKDIDTLMRSPEVGGILKKKGEVQHETQHLRKDGTVFPVEVKSKFIESEGAAYICSIARDLTERKNFEEELMKKNKNLEDYKDIVVGRELKMMELKKEINKLHKEIGKPPPYELP